MKSFVYTFCMCLIITHFTDALEVHNAAYDPMVAFVCNKGAMHMDPTTGWTIDPFTNCLEDKSSILAYCQRTYSNLDIRNVVETTNEMTIKGWCALGTSDCKSSDTFTVQAYRCLAGAFQSDVLIVPDDCKFEHKQGNQTCKDFNYWANVATRSCSGQSDMKLHSYGTLLPCGTDLWSGVEFVCCPPGEEANEEDDAVNKYLHLQLVGGLYTNEHDAYELAKHRQAEANREKSSKLLEEWYAARARVVEMQETDPKRAEEMNKEISERFSREYEAMRSQENQEMSQLEEVHQQHVQLNLNSKKRMAMQKLMEELHADSPDADDLFSLLQNYILVEQKDATHCVKHFVKVRARDSDAARSLLPATVEHLTLISKRINQSIGLFDMLPNQALADRLKANAAAWVTTSSFSIEETLTLLDELPEAKPIEKVEKMSSTTAKVITRKPAQTDKSTTSSRSSAANHSPVTPDRAEDMPVAKTQGHKKVTVEEETTLYMDNTPAAETDRIAWPLIAFLITFVTLSALVVILIAFLVAKTSRRTRKRKSHNYLEVSQSVHSLGPEDRHITAMQNGYENPTYALLEQKKV